MISALDNQLALSTKVTGSLGEKKKAPSFAIIQAGHSTGHRKRKRI